VTFLDGGNSIGSSQMNASGVAYLDTNLLAPGSHSLSAQFQGDMQYGFGLTSYVAAIFSPSTSNGALVIVTADTTAVSLTSSSGSATAGTVATFSAQVSSGAGAPFGGASFFDGNTLLGTIGLDSHGKASYSTASLSTGTHSITAAFNANGPYGGSVSAPLSFSISSAAANAAATYVSLAMQMDASGAGASLVASIYGGTVPSGGTITFLDAGKILGTATVNASGVAAVSVPQFENGAHTLTASFSGAAMLAPAVSPALVEQWPSAGPGFSLAIAKSQSLAPGSVGSWQVSVLPFRDFRQTVQLSCADGLPEGYTCAFSPAELVNGAGNSALLISASSRTVRAQRVAAYLPAMLLIPMAFLFFGTGNDRRFRIFLVLLAVSLGGLLSGCNSSTRSVQMSVVTVQASSGTGAQAVIHSVQVPLRLPKNH